MKKIIILIFITALIFQVQAQITINDTDMPSTGTLYIRDQASNPGIIDPTLTGANQTWDYSQLTVAGTDTTEYQTVSTTPVLYQVYFNNIILYSNWKADLALPGLDIGANIPQSPVSITNVINYFKITPSAYYQVGFGATINSVTASQRYDPRDKLLKLPNTFGLVDSNDFYWLFVIPGLATYGQSKTRINETDGWGTLQLPNATYNTLRVKSTVRGIDTIHVDLLNLGFAVPSTQYEYRWYANGEGEPVFIVSAADVAGIPTANGANFKHTTPSGIAPQNDLFSAYTVSPNPVSDQVNIHYKTTKGGRITVSLYDITGRQIICEKTEIFPGDNQNFLVDVHSFSKGYYTLKIKTGNEISGCKLVIY